MSTKEHGTLWHVMDTASFIFFKTLKWTVIIICVLLKFLYELAKDMDKPKRG